jgi:MFS family permease
MPPPGSSGSPPTVVPEPRAVPRERLLTSAFLLCFAGTFVQGMAFNLYLHLPGYLKDLGADEVAIGFIWSLTAGAALLVRPWVGRAMDDWGRRPVILVGNALNVVTLSLYLTVSEIGPWVWLIRVVHGLAESMLFAGFFTYAADVVPASRRTQGLALFSVSGMLPIALGPLLGDAILARAGYSELFSASVVLAVASLLVALPLREAKPLVEPGEGSRGFTAAAMQRNLLPLWFMGTVFATAIAGPFTFLKTYLAELDFGSMGLFFSAYSFAAIGVRVGLGWLPDWAGPKRVLLPSFAVLAVGLALIPTVSSDAGLAAAGVLCGLGHGMANPILNGLVVTRARPAELGAAMALYTAVFDAGALIGGPVLGGVARGLGYPPMFAVAAALVVCGVLVFTLWDRGR